MGFVLSILLGCYSVNLEVVSMVWSWNSTFTYLRVVAVVVVTFTASWVWVLGVRPKLSLGIIIHHIYFGEVDLFVFQNVTAWFTNTIHVSNSSDIFSYQCSRARLSDSVRGVLRNYSADIDCTIRLDLVVLMVSTGEVYLLTCYIWCGSVNDGLSCNSTCIAAALVVTCMSLPAIIITLESWAHGSSGHADMSIPTTRTVQLLTSCQSLSIA